MNEVLARRLAAMTGVALAAAVTLWWLGSTRLALDHGSDGSRSSATTLHALWLVRGIGLALLAVRVGALHGWRPGTAQALALIAPSWPVVVLVWSASPAAWTQVALAEALLLASGIALPLVGVGLRRALRRQGLAELVGTALGTALAACLWLTRGSWTLPLP